MKIFANWSRIHEVKPTEKLEELKKGRKRRRKGVCMAPVFEEDGEDQGVPRQIRSVAKISEGRLKQILCLKKNQGKMKPELQVVRRRRRTKGEGGLVLGEDFQKDSDSCHVL